MTIKTDSTELPDLRTYKHVLFWGPAITWPSYGDMRGINLLVDGIFALALGVLPPNEPKHHIRPGIPRADREALAVALASGKKAESYFGYAECRICSSSEIGAVRRTEIGCADLYGWGYIWPAGAEHYILEHDVWTPDCTRLLAAVRRDVAK
jgi:hypothetical protein